MKIFILSTAVVWLAGSIWFTIGSLNEVQSANRFGSNAQRTQATLLESRSYWRTTFSTNKQYFEVQYSFIANNKIYYATNEWQSISPDTLAKAEQTKHIPIKYDPLTPELNMIDNSLPPIQAYVRLGMAILSSLLAVAAVGYMAYFYLRQHGLSNGKSL